MKNIRGSPSYFEQTTKDLFAIIRQLDPANLFCSFSATETQWIHLQILGEVIDGCKYSEEEVKDGCKYSEEEVMNMSWEEKCCLIEKEPVLCA